MENSGDSGPFRRFALALYRRAGVADACLDLQDRHDLDVNLVLFAAYVGAVRRQGLTDTDLARAHRQVDAWHQQVVRPLRAVRQGLRSGPAPAPGEATTALRRKLARVEIEAELIELDQLGLVISPAPAPGNLTSAADGASAAIEAVIREHISAPSGRQDHQAIEVIATQAHAVDAGSPATA